MNKQEAINAILSIEVFNKTTFVEKVVCNWDVGGNNATPEKFVLDDGDRKNMINMAIALKSYIMDGNVPDEIIKLINDSCYFKALPQVYNYDDIITDIINLAVKTTDDKEINQSPKVGRQNQNENIDKQPCQIIFSDKLLDLLQKSGFIENTTIPYKWIAVNKKSKGAFYSKKSLFDLLCLLEYSDNTIKDRRLLNSYFNFPNNMPILPQQYTLISKNGNIIRPIVSEYHTELEEIVNKSKEK